MRQLRRARNRRRSGFTLLEILLVVGIIALLAAFVVPTFVGVRGKAERDIAKRMVEDGGHLATQIELFHNAVGSYPEELKYLHEKPEEEELAEKWTGPYITDTAKLKDPWGHELKYRKEGEFREGSYDLWSMGPDGEDGTDDDIGNWAKDTD